MICTECEDEGRDGIAFATLETASHPGICMMHLRSLIEMMLFLAREGPQTQEDIEQHLNRFEELYPYPTRVEGPP